MTHGTRRAAPRRAGPSHHARARPQATAGASPARAPAPATARALLAAALLLLLAPPAPAASRDADARLRALGEEFLARMPGPRADGGPGDGEPADHAFALGAGGRAAELAWLRDLQARLAALPRGDLSHGRAQEHRLLEARVERERLLREVIRPFVRDPGSYAPRAADPVAAALESATGSPCDRAQVAAGHLTRVPELLRAARVHLKDPPRVLVENAIAEFAAVLRFYRETVPRLASGCRVARLQADLAEADTAAVRAVAEFIDYLREDVLPVADGVLPIGPEASHRLLRTLLLEEPAPVESLLADAERAVAGWRAELEALAPGIAGSGSRAALAALAVEGPGAEGPVPYVGRRLAEVRGFLKARDLVTLPSRTDLRVRRALPPGPGREPIALAPPAPRDGRSEPRSPGAWLEVAVEARAPGREAARARLNRWETDLAVAHEGLPGRHLRALALRRSPSRLRAALQEAWPARDWGIYCERMILEEGYGEGDPRYRLAAAARALRQEGRSLAALALHTGALSPEEARLMLQSRCLLDPEEAAREVQRAAADPDLMGYTLGARRLLDLRDGTRRGLGPRFRGKVFNDALLRFGASPPGLVRTDVLRELGAEEAGTPVGVKP